jgi:hypothetical protein
MLGITLTNLIPSVRPSKTELPPAGIDTTRSMFWVSGLNASGFVHWGLCTGLQMTD